MKPPGVFLSDTKVVHDTADTRDAFGDVLGPPPPRATLHYTGQRNLGLRDRHLDFAGIQLLVVGQPLVGVPAIRSSEP